MQLVSQRNLGNGHRRVRGWIVRANHGLQFEDGLRPAFASRLDHSLHQVGQRGPQWALDQSKSRVSSGEHENFRVVSLALVSRKVELLEHLLAGPQAGE